MALDIIPRNVDIIPRVDRDPDPIPLKVGVHDVDVVIPDLIEETRQSFSENWAQIRQEFASFGIKKSSDLVRGGGGGEPEPDVCAAQSIDGTGVLVSFRAL